MKKVNLGNIFALFIPIVIAFGMFFLWMGQDKRRRALETKEAGVRQQNATLNTLKSQLDSQLLAQKTIAADATEQEQAEFLTQLRLKAARAKVKLTSYANRGVPPPRDPKNPGQQIFRPVASSVEVQGPYGGIREFSFSLLRDQRLMNMSGVRWHRARDRDERGQTTLSFTLIRYVTDPAPRPAPQTVATATPVGGGLQ